MMIFAEMHKTATSRLSKQEAEKHVLLLRKFRDDEFKWYKLASRGYMKLFMFLLFCTSTLFTIQFQHQTPLMNASTAAWNEAVVRAKPDLVITNPPAFWQFVANKLVGVIFQLPVAYGNGDLSQTVVLPPVQPSVYEQVIKTVVGGYKNIASEEEGNGDSKSSTSSDKNSTSLIENIPSDENARFLRGSDSVVAEAQLSEAEQEYAGELAEDIFAGLANAAPVSTDSKPATSVKLAGGLTFTRQYPFGGLTMTAHRVKAVEGCSRGQSCVTDEPETAPSATFNGHKDDGTFYSKVLSQKDRESIPVNEASFNMLGFAIKGAGPEDHNTWGFVKSVAPGDTWASRDPNPIKVGDRLVRIGGKTRQVLTKQMGGSGGALDYRVFLNSGRIGGPKFDDTIGDTVLEFQKIGSVLTETVPYDSHNGGYSVYIPLTSKPNAIALLNRYRDLNFFNPTVTKAVSISWMAYNPIGSVTLCKFQGISML